MRIKEINRTINFDSRALTSPYRCKYGDKSKFDLLKINVTFNNKIRDTYEIEATHLPDGDSISFKAVPTNDGYEILSWTPKDVAQYIIKK